jgi:hypothetical protein
MVVATVAAVVRSALDMQLEDTMGLHFARPMPPFALVLVLGGTAVGWLLGRSFFSRRRRGSPGRTAAAAAWVVLLRVVGRPASATG